MAVLSPVKVVIENFPEGHVEWLDAVNNPEDPAAGTRKVPFTRELYVEADDFMEVAPKKYFRLTPGQEVRFRWAYFVKCVGVDKDAAGNSHRRALHLRSGDTRRRRPRRTQGQGHPPLGLRLACRSGFRSPLRTSL